MLHLLPSALFVHLCQFITLRDKCVNLITSHRHFYTTFNTSTCCRHDVIALNFARCKGHGQHVNQPIGRSPNRFISQSNNHSTLHHQLPYLRYVRGIVIDIGEPRQSASLLACMDEIIITQLSSVDASTDYLTNQSILTSAFQGTHLQCFHVVEVVRRKHSVIRLFLDALDQAFNQTINPDQIDEHVDPSSISQLRELSLNLRFERSGLELLIDTPMLKWRALSRCTSLHTVNLRLDDRYSMLLDQDEVLDSFPSSVTSLKISHCIVSLREGLWQRAFQSTKFLPILQSFDISVLSPGFDVFADAQIMSTTVMDATNQVRPLRSMAIMLSDVRHLAVFKNLISLRLHMSPYVVHDFVSLPNNLLANLQTLDCKVIHPLPATASPALGLAPLLNACPSTIRELRLWMQVYAVEPLSTDSVARLSMMKQLTILSICMFPTAEGPTFARRQIDDVLLPGDLQSLETINLCGAQCSLQQLRALFSAAPSLKIISLTNFTSFVPAEHASALALPVLSLLATHCPLIAHVDLADGMAQQRLSRAQLESFFSKCSLSSLRHLVILDVALLADDQAMHFLLARLSNLPQLKSFRVKDRHPMTKFRICLQRVLPHLRQLQYYEEVAGLYFRSAPPSPDFYKYLIKLEHSRAARDQSMSDEQWRNNFLQPVGRCELVFRESYDQEGLDGREAFFADLFDDLPEATQRLLEAWDLGFYGNSLCHEPESSTQYMNM